MIRKARGADPRKRIRACQSSILMCAPVWPCMYVCACVCGKIHADAAMPRILAQDVQAMQKDLVVLTCKREDGPQRSPGQDMGIGIISMSSTHVFVLQPCFMLPARPITSAQQHLPPTTWCREADALVREVRSSMRAETPIQTMGGLPPVHGLFLNPKLCRKRDTLMLTLFLGTLQYKFGRR